MGSKVSSFAGGSWTWVERVTAAGGLLLLVAFCGPTLLTLAQVYRSDASHSHGLVVPPVAAVALFRRSRWIRRAVGASGMFGFLPMMTGMGFVFLGRWYETALQPGYLGHVFLQGAGTVLCLMGFAWVALGFRAFCVMAGPLAYLWLAVPLPESIAIHLTLPLRRFAAVAAAALLRMANVPVLREGNVLQLANGALGIEEACSGIRSLGVFVAVAFALILLMRLRGARAGILVASAPFWAVAANIARIMISAAMVELDRGDLVTGAWHQWLGLGAVALGGIGMFGLGQKLQTRRDRDDAASTDPRPDVGRQADPVRTRSQVRRRRAATTVATLALLAGCVLAVGMEHHYRRQQSRTGPLTVHRKPFTEFPAQVGNFTRVATRDLLPVELRNLEPSDRFVGVYRNEHDVEILLTMIYWRPERIALGDWQQVKLPHYPQNCYPGAGWMNLETFEDAVDVPWLGGRTVNTLVFEKAGRRRAVVFWREHGIPGERLFVPRDLGVRLRILIDSWHTPVTGDVLARYSISVAADFAGSGGGAAIKDALTFSRQIAPILPAFGIGANDSVPADRESTP